jgi:hypothetical protein
MRPLFVTVVCDWCDGLVDVSAPHRGFVVWRNRPEGSSEYVFRTEADAARWRELQALSAYPIREVRSPSPFRWRRPSGTARGIELADHLYEIFPDHRFAPAPYRAFLH